jgi:hypothetical protein
VPPKFPTARPLVLLAVLASLLGSVVPSAVAGTQRTTSTGHHARTHRSQSRCVRTHSRRTRRHTAARCVRRRATKRRAPKPVAHKSLTATIAAGPASTAAVRVTAPNVTLTSQPADPTTASTARFTWTTSGTLTSVVCSENGSMWAKCSSGITYTNAKQGLNQFSVKVANSAGSKIAYSQWHVTTTSGTGTVTPPANPPTTTTPTTSTTPPTTTPTTGANPFGKGMFGIAAGSTLQNEAGSSVMAQDLTNDQNAGAKWIRIDINWAQIQYAGPGTYYWTTIDAAVRQAEADGMRVLGTIAYTPNWARPAGASSMSSPDPSQYASFAAAAAAHYSALGVHAYEIWNEENISAFWKPSPNPAAYTTLLKAAYPAIHGADPSATVILGGLSPAASDGTNYTPPDFLKAIYANGGHGYFDAVGNHPYTWPAYPGETYAWSAWYQMYGTTTSLRSLMVANGDTSKLIWGTEFGAPTNGPSGASFVSQATQAAMITKAYQLWATYSWAGPLFTYDGRDMGTSTNTTQNFFGLSNYDFSPKPAYRAYQAAVAAP